MEENEIVLFGSVGQWASMFDDVNLQLQYVEPQARRRLVTIPLNPPENRYYG